VQFDGVFVESGGTNPITALMRFTANGQNCIGRGVVFSGRLVLPGKLLLLMLPVVLAQD